MELSQYLSCCKISVETRDPVSDFGIKVIDLEFFIWRTSASLGVLLCSMINLVACIVIG